MPFEKLFPVALLACLALAPSACGDTAGGPVGLPDTTTFAPDTTPPEDTAVDPDAPPEALSIDGVSPDEGTTPGLQQVEISGTGLRGVTQVFFGDAAALDVFAVSEHRLVCLTPPQNPGFVDVVVVDADGIHATLARGFHYRDPIQVTAVEPPSGHWLGGDAITVFGAGFTADSMVLIGDRPALAVKLVDAQSLTAVTPEGAPGQVDVHVSSSEGVGRLKNGFAYIGDALPTATTLRVSGIAPAHGPVAGGTEVQIEGSGFGPGAVVRIGALPATNVHVADNGARISCKTALGSPGEANVRVIMSGQVATLENGFTYDGPPAVWAVDPPAGAMAGGTLVAIHGNGFPTRGTVEVLFGDQPAVDVDVRSDQLIVATTPPGDVGQVPVTVSGDGVEATHPRGFTYFDPSASPGTWGEPIDGNLNVTVIEANSGARVAGAFVLVGPSLSTSHRGYTNTDGQITFSGADLIGEQTVSASAQGYQVFQLGGFDAENVTIAIAKIPSCEDIKDIPCDILVEPPPSSELYATIVGSNKGPTIPFGSCRDWPDAPNGLCAACSTDDDCVAQGGTSGNTGGDDVSGGVGVSPFGPSRCTELGGEGSFCSSGCVTDADCPDTFVCLDPSGLDEDRRCVPPPGEWAAYCDITETDMNAEQLIPYPGVLVAPDHTVQITTRLGNYALFCWGGHIVRSEFRPEYLGVTRQLGAFIDGETVTAEVKLDIPLDEKVQVEVERPTLGPVDDERTLLRTLMNLGGDGVLEFPPQRAFNGRHFELMVPAKLDGVLYDASWDLYVEVDVPPLNGGSAAIEPNLTDLNPVIDYRWDGAAWEPFVGFKQTIHSMAVIAGAGGGGDGTEALLAVGDEGLVARSFNGTWARQQGGTDRDLYAVAAAPSAAADGVQHALVGGVGGYLAHWDGLRWTTTPTPSGVVATVEGLAFADDTRAFAVAGPALLAWDGSAWTVAYEASVDLHAVAADATHVWAAGDSGVIVHGEGLTFTEEATGFGALRALWRAPDNGLLVAVGDGGTILTSGDGVAFSVASSGVDHDLYTVWGRSSSDVWAGGTRATILHWDGASWADQTPTQTRGSVRALAGIAGGDVLALGSHELVLGPLLGIPEGLQPEPNNFLEDHLSWTSRAGILPHFTVLDIQNEVGPCSACGAMFMIPYGEWQTVLDGDLFAGTFPDFNSVAGALGLGWGVKTVSIYRVRTEDGFDFDHTASTGFYGGTWRAWSWRTESWFR
ncbi:MAG: IPT/TIG domain-containing protein [Myxococcota bacterium]